MDLPITKTAFWDTDISKLDEFKHADFIIVRVFQYGLEVDLRAVIKFYTPEQIKKAISAYRGMDKHAKALAQLFC